MKMKMKNKKNKAVIAVAIGMTVGLSAGCVDQISEEDVSKQLALDIEKEAMKETLERVNMEKKDLTEKLAEMQKEDSSIVQLYYSYDDEGSKILNVVREENDGSFVNYTIAAGLMYMLMNNNHHAGYHGYLNQHSKSVYKGTKIQEEKHRNYLGGLYISSIKSSNVSSIKSNPAKMKNMKSGAFSRVQSSRSTSYSKGS